MKGRHIVLWLVTAAVVVLSMSLLFDWDMEDGSGSEEGSRTAHASGGAWGQSEPDGQADTPRVAITGRSEVVPADVQAMATGIQGRVILPEGAPGVKATVSVRGPDASPALGMEVDAPGAYEYSWDGHPPVVEVRARAPGYLETRRFARRGDPDVDLRMTPSGRGGTLRWALAQGKEAVAPDTVRAHIHPAEDPRSERKDCSTEEFFLGLRHRITGFSEAIVDQEVRGRPAADGTCQFLLSEVPCGEMVIHLVGTSGNMAATRARIHSGRATDLGVLELTSDMRDIHVVEETKLRAVEGARVTPLVDGWPASCGALSDAHGIARVNAAGGSSVLVVKEGYLPGSSTLEGTSQTIELSPMEGVSVLVRPGNWVYVLEGGVETVALADADGRARIPGSTRNMIECDPTTWDYWGRPVRDGKPVAGPCSAEFEVTCGESALDQGSILLRRKGTTDAFVAGFHDGRACFEDLPEGVYVGSLRVGAQVHDNDHEYILPMLHLSAGKIQRSYSLPDGIMNLRVLSADYTPLSGAVVTIRCQGRDSTSGLEYKISSRAATDGDGRISFGVLPRTSVTIRVGGSEFERVVPDEPVWLEYVLP